VKILVVEDDRSLADVLRRGLCESGHVVDVERNGAAVQSLATAVRYDALVLDIALPGKDGLTIARELRAADVRTPILMLTARDTIGDVIAGLDAGADDYLRKPFVFDELEARLRSITRREAVLPRQELRVGEVAMDLGTRSATCRGREIILSARETAFLEYFLRNPGRLLTRSMFENALWERDRETTSNIIDVYVRKLRIKLSADGIASPIETVRGAGYRLRSTRS
jgi:two-component system, OmpR family, response regulator